MISNLYRPYVKVYFQSTAHHADKSCFGTRVQYTNNHHRVVSVAMAKSGARVSISVFGWKRSPITLKTYCSTIRSHKYRCAIPNWWTDLCISQYSVGRKNRPFFYAEDDH